LLTLIKGGLFPNSYHTKSSLFREKGCKEMKKILFILCLTLCVLSLVTPVSATPIAESESVTWLFNTQSYEGSFFGVSFRVDFIDDFLKKDEELEWFWSDEIGGEPLWGKIWDFKAGSSTHTIHPWFISNTLISYPANEDLYLTITMIHGSVNVSEGTPILETLYPISGPDIVGTSVPDATVMLLLGSSLLGLGVFSRKSKRSKSI